MNNKLVTLLYLLFLLGSTVGNAQELTNSQQLNINNKWRISFDAGIGYRLASTKNSKQALISQGFDSNEVDNYFKEIKWGPKASAQFHYLFNPTYGIGIDYQFHHSSGSLTGIIDPGDELTLYYGTTKDNVYTNYIGLSFYFQEWIIQNKIKVYGQTSLGIGFFRQETTSLYSPVLITGKALGTNVEIGLEYFVSNHIALGIHLNYFQSAISKITIDDGNSQTEVELEKEQFEGLGRLDSGLGVKFYF